MADKNPFEQNDHREAFDLAIKLALEGLDSYEVAKQLDGQMSRKVRLKISSKAARVIYWQNRKQS